MHSAPLNCPFQWLLWTYVIMFVLLCHLATILWRGLSIFAIWLLFFLLCPLTDEKLCCGFDDRCSGNLDTILPCWSSNNLLVAVCCFKNSHIKLQTSVVSDTNYYSLLLQYDLVIFQCNFFFIFVWSDPSWSYSDGQT